MAATAQIGINGTLYSRSLIDSADTKQSAQKKITVWQMISDWVGCSRHEEIIGALFDIAKPKDSVVFLNGILSLSNLLKDDSKHLRFEITKLHGDSIVSVNFGRQTIAAGVFKGEIATCIFEKDDDRFAGRGTYKLKTDLPSKIFYCPQGLVDQINSAYLPASDYFQDNERGTELSISNVQNVFRETAEEEDEDKFACFKTDLSRTCLALPLHSDDPKVITKRIYLERIKTILESVGIKDIPEVGNPENLDSAFLAFLNGLDWKEILNNPSLSSSDKTFIIIVGLQSLRYPILGVGRYIPTAIDYIEDHYKYQPEQSSGAEAGIYIYREISNSDGEVTIDVASEFEFSLNKFSHNPLNKFAVSEPLKEPVFAKQASSGSYTVKFDENNCPTIKFQPGEVKLTLRDSVVAGNAMISTSKPSDCLERGSGLKPAFLDTGNSSCYSPEFEDMLLQLKSLEQETSLFESRV